MPTNPPNQSTGDHPPPVGDFIDHPNPGRESAKLGYETTDVNTGGIIVFLGGLFGFVLIFFVFCFFMGKVINEALNKQDGPSDKWHTSGQIFAGAKNNADHKRENLKSSAAMDQQELGNVANAFPGPQLQTDDGNQATADLHAREDLLLDHYSSVPGQPIRIPIDRAMELIVQRGLPVAPAVTAPGTEMAGDKKPTISAPLTSGFARTGYELDTIEAREQRLMYGKAESNTHAQLQPIKPQRTGATQ